MNRVRRSGTPVSARALLLAAMIVIIALLTVLLVDRFATGDPSSPDPSRPGPTAGAQGVGGSVTPRSGLPTVQASALPAEATSVLALIDAGGPFRYVQDGTVFNNFEGRLPQRATGYYHEYTVPTPGMANRGTRRLIVGRDGDVYYTGDHYQTFRQVIR